MNHRVIQLYMLKTTCRLSTSSRKPIRSSRSCHTSASLNRTAAQKLERNMAVRETGSGKRIFWLKVWQGFAIRNQCIYRCKYSELTVSSNNQRMGNRGRRSYHATKPRSRLTLTTPQSREATKPLADIPSLALLNTIKPQSCKKRKTWSNLSAQRARPRLHATH